MTQTVGGLAGQSDLLFLGIDRRCLKNVIMPVEAPVSPKPDAAFRLPTIRCVIRVLKRSAARRLDLFVHFRSVKSISGTRFRAAVYDLRDRRPSFIRPAGNAHPLTVDKKFRHGKRHSAVNSRQIELFNTGCAQIELRDLSAG